MIHIISGPSCAGKSTLINSAKIHSIANVSSKQPVLFPKDIENDSGAIQDNCFLHYNILRAADKSYRSSNNKAQQMYSFMSDAPWAEVNEIPQPKKAIILLTSRSILEERMSSRQHIEPRNLTGYSPSDYPVNHWLQVLNGVDLEEIYSSWCTELKLQEIEYTLINSENSNYEIIIKEDLKLNA